MRGTILKSLEPQMNIWL